MRSYDCVTVHFQQSPLFVSRSVTKTSTVCEIFLQDCDIRSWMRAWLPPDSVWAVKAKTCVSAICDLDTSLSSDTNLWALLVLWCWRSQCGRQLKTQRRRFQPLSDLHTSPSESGRRLEEPHSSSAGPRWSFEDKRGSVSEAENSLSFYLYLHIDI